MASAGMNTVAVGIAVQSDWDNRHFSSSLSLNVRRLFEFLLQFDPVLHQQRCHASYLARGNLEPFLHLSVSSAPKEESATRSKLAVLNEKLTVLERQLEYLEAQFSTAVNSS
ncbi:hypothetical protein CY35_09G052500 [Sphagnum magellanicum]|nr:hypothetical protein CY35_09G052500 [Sphagnum magellanicum]